MREVDASNASLLERRRAEKAALVEQDKKIARFIHERDARQQVADLPVDQPSRLSLHHGHDDSKVDAAQLH